MSTNINCKYQPALLTSNFNNSEETHNQHHGVIDEFVATATRMGKKVTIKSDDELQPTDILGTDLVVSMGKYYSSADLNSLV